MADVKEFVSSAVNRPVVLVCVGDPPVERDIPRRTSDSRQPHAVEKAASL